LRREKEEGKREKEKGLPEVPWALCLGPLVDQQNNFRSIRKGVVLDVHVRLRVGAKFKFKLCKL
jgi:hypothetical protein